MKESLLVQKIIRAVREAYPTAYVRKLADRFNRGLPDVLILFNSIYGVPKSLFVEAKTDRGVLSEIQKQEHHDIARAGGIVVVARDAEFVLDVLMEMKAL